MNVAVVFADVIKTSVSASRFVIAVDIVCELFCLNSGVDHSRGEDAVLIFLWRNVDFDGEIVRHGE